MRNSFPGCLFSSVIQFCWLYNHFWIHLDRVPITLASLVYTEGVMNHPSCLMKKHILWKVGAINGSAKPCSRAWQREFTNGAWRCHFLRRPFFKRCLCSLSELPAPAVWCQTTDGMPSWYIRRSIWIGCTSCNGVLPCADATLCSVLKGH